MPPKPASGTVNTVERAFDILEYLDETGGAGISELASALGIAKSTVHRHIKTLHERGYVVADGDIYRTGLEFLRLGNRARRRRHGYTEIVEKVDQVAAETEERAQFIVAEHGKAVYAYRATGANAVCAGTDIGNRVPLHATSAGKAILVFGPRERVDRHVERYGLELFTDRTITDPERLQTELERIRERGYSVNDQETVEGLRTIGVPIRDPADRVLGAVSVSGPSYRMRGDWFDSTVPDLLLGIANEIER